MWGLGIGATMRRRRRRNTQIVRIEAILRPESSLLVVGQTLADTANWEFFASPANYLATTSGQTIADVTVNYIGDTVSANDPLGDGDTNNFSISVSDTGGNTWTFTVSPRIVVFSPPVAVGALADQSVTAGTGERIFDASSGFTGAGLTFSISNFPGVSIDAQTGIVSLDTNELTLQAGTAVTVTATNSGGSAQGVFLLNVLASVNYVASIAGLTDNATYGPSAEIGQPLSGVVGPLQGGETVLHRWLDDTGVIAGAETSFYTAVSAQNQQTIRYAPIVDGIAVVSDGVVARHVPPVAGTLAPVVEVQGSGTPTVSLEAGFTGDDLTFAESVSWASVTGSTLTINDEVRSDTVTITASNSGGSAQVVLSVNISAPAAAVISPISDQTVAQGSGAVTIDLRTVFSNATSYSVIAGASASIDGDGFTLRLDDGTLTANQTVTVRGSNANNSADDTFLFTVEELAETAMVLTFETTAPNETFTLPMRNIGTYNATMTIDGGSDISITSFDDADLTQTVPAAGIHTLRYDGQLGQVQFSQDATSAAKVRTVALGATVWSNMQQAFDGCSGATSFEAQQVDTSACTNWFAAFRGWDAGVSFNANGMSFAAAENLQQTWAGWDQAFDAASICAAVAATSAALQVADECFYSVGNPGIKNIDLTGWNITKMIDNGTPYSYTGGFFNFIENPTQISTANYDSTLQSWAGRIPIDTPFDVANGGGFICDFQQSQPTMGGAVEAARRTLIDAGFYLEDAESARCDKMLPPDAVANGETQVDVTFAAIPRSNGLPVTHFNVRYSTDEANWTEVGGDLPLQTAIPNGFSITGLTAGTLYYVQTRGAGFPLNDDGRGDWSDSNTVIIDSEPVVSAAATITIASGTVAEDMTGFPVYVDMATLPEELWTELDADGGNLRATNAADDVEYPFDLAWVDKPNRKGTVIVRCDLATASDTDFVLRARTTGTVAPAVTDPNGRNAVWADHLAVVLGPDPNVDRTGNHSITLAGEIGPKWNMTARSGDTGQNQGIAWDGTHWFVTATASVKKYDSDWNLVQESATVLADTGISGVNHCGDPCIIGGELFIPIEDYPSGPYVNQHICVFNTADLTFNRSYDISAQGREISSFALDPVSGELFVSDFEDGSSLMRYNATTGAYIGTLALNPALSSIQGITFARGHIYLATNSSGIFEVNTDGSVRQTPIYDQGTESGTGNIEGLESIGDTLYNLHDGDNIGYEFTDAPSDFIQWRSNTSSLPSSIRVEDISPATVWTASGTFRPRDFVEAGILSLTESDSANNNTRATAGVRSTGNWNAWNSSDSWMAPGSVVEATAGVERRLAFGHNGTIERKLNLDGAPYAVDAGIGARPTGATFDWLMGIEDNMSGERYAGDGSFMYLHSQYLSDNWLAAEYANLNDPGAFYSVTGGTGGGPANFIVEETGEQVEFNFPATNDSISLTIAGSQYGETYTTDADGNMLTGNLLNGTNTRLTKPVITADIAIPNRLNVLPSLIIANAANQTPSSWQWRKDGVDIPGATNVFYDAVQADDGSNITVVETDADTGPPVTSNTFAFTFEITFPGQMDAPSIKVNSGTQVTITKAGGPPANGSPITSYDLEYSTDGGQNYTTVTDFTSPFVLSGLTTMQDVNARTRAVNGIGGGRYSADAVTRTAAGAAYNILDLADDDLLLALYPLNDPSRLYTDEARTTNVTTTGDFVRGIEDISGLGRHASIGSNRYTWNATGYVDLSNANSSAAFVTASNAGDFPDIVEMYFVIKTTDTRYVLACDEGTRGNIPFYAFAGGSGAPYLGAVGAPTLADGQYDLVSSTFGSVAVQFSTNTWKVASTRDVNGAAFRDSPLRMLNGGANDQLTGQITHIALTGQLTATQRTDLISKLETETPS